MAHFIETLVKGYHTLNDEWSDPRSSNWLFMSNPFYMIFIVASYVYTMMFLGPRIMKNKKPFDIDKFVLVYNIMQVLTNLYLFQKVFPIWFWKYNWKCEPVDFSNNENALLVAEGAHSYFLLKLSDLLDTIFFLLRKKNSQITFLHLYHHGGMVIISWTAVKFVPGGHSVFIGLINAIVHSVMYMYYFLTSWNSEYKKSIWWKKHLTQLQLLQFLLVAIQQLLPLSYHCNYPKFISIFMPLQTAFMFLMFTDFYIKTYVSERKKSPSQ